MSDQLTKTNRSRRNISKIILSILVVGFFCLLIAIAALPSILSTSWGNEKIAQLVNSKISGKIAFKNLHLSWLKEQSLEDAQLFDSEGQQIASLASASAKTPLWNFIFNNGKKGAYDVSGLNAQVFQEADGQTNIQHALAEKGTVKSTDNAKQGVAITLNEVNASGFIGIEKTNHIQLSGKTSQGMLEGSFNINVSFGDINKDTLFANQHHLNTDQIGKMQIHANTTNFPVRLLDEALSVSAPSYRGLVLAALGDKLDLDLEEAVGLDGIDLNLKINTSFVHGKLNAVLKDDRLIVNEPDSIEMTIQPKLIEILNQLIASENKIQLKKPTQGHFNLSKMNLVFDLQKNRSFIDLANSYILGNFIVDQADLVIAPVGDISLQKFNLMIDAPPNKSDKIVFVLESQAARNSEITQINFKGSLNKLYNSEELSSLKNIEMALDMQDVPVVFLTELAGTSPLLIDVLGQNINAQVSFVSNDFNAEIKSDAAHAKIAGRLENWEKFLLTSPATLHYNLNPAAMNILGLNGLKLDGSSQIHVNVDTDQRGINFFDLSGLQLKGLLKIDQINLYDNAGTLQQLSVPWEISAPNNMIALQFNALTKLDSGKSQGAVEGFLKISPWIDGNEINFSQSHLASHIKLMNFPVAFIEKMGSQNDLISLIGPTINVDLNAQIPVSQKQSGSIQLAFNGKNLNGQGSATIENGKNIAFSLNGQHQESSTPLPFSINGRAENPFTPSGELNINNLVLGLDAKFQKFPIKILGRLLGIKDEIRQRIAATLGETINADIHMQIDHLNGPVKAQLSGNNGSAALDAQINHGVLTLNKNFQTQITLTQEFGRDVLEDIFPLARGLIGSDNPLTINVDAAGFALPLKNFDIRSVKIGSASLELGKVHFRRDGQLGVVLSLLNAFKGDTITVWFTPIYASMQNGVVNLRRMDMLIMDTYPIATWGIVDLGADKVNMMIGLTGQSLLKGFNIIGLGKDYILQIPFKGTINNASIDKKTATAKIAAVMAASRGPQGMLIGTALHIAAGVLSEKNAPPPTTNPLPWSTGDDAQQTSQPDSNHPLHKVEEKASTILRNLLPF